MFNKNPANTAPGLLKFKPPEDPYDEEKKKKIWEVPNILKMQYINEKLSEKEIKLTDKQGVYAHLGSEEYSAKLNAIEVYKMQIEMEAYDAECNDCYIREFRDFLLGKSKYNKDPIFKAKVPWGEHRLLGADIDAYIDAMIDKKLDFDKKIAKMTMFKLAPRNIQDAWLYYVFIVTGKTPPVDLFLKPWDAFYNIPENYKPVDPLYEKYIQTPNAPEPKHVRDMTEPGLMGPREGCGDDFDMDKTEFHGPVVAATHPTGAPETDVTTPPPAPASELLINDPDDKAKEEEKVFFNVIEEVLKEAEEKIPEQAEQLKEVAQNIQPAIESANNLALPEHTQEVQTTLKNGFEQLAGKLDSIADLLKGVTESIAGNKDLLAKMTTWRNEDKENLEKVRMAVTGTTLAINDLGQKLGAQHRKEDRNELTRMAQMEELLSNTGKTMQTIENLSGFDSMDRFQKRWEEHQAEKKAKRAEEAASLEETKQARELAKQNKNDALAGILAELINMKEGHLTQGKLKDAAVAALFDVLSPKWLETRGNIGVSRPALDKEEAKDLPEDEVQHQQLIRKLQRELEVESLNAQLGEKRSKTNKYTGKEEKALLKLAEKAEEEELAKENAEKKRKEEEDKNKRKEEKKKVRAAEKAEKDAKIKELEDRLIKAERQKEGEDFTTETNPEFEGKPSFGVKKEDEEKTKKMETEKIKPLVQTAQDVKLEEIGKDIQIRVEEEKQIKAAEDQRRLDKMRQTEAEIAANVRYEEEEERKKAEETERRAREHINNMRGKELSHQLNDTQNLTQFGHNQTIQTPEQIQRESAYQSQIIRLDQELNELASNIQALRAAKMPFDNLMAQFEIKLNARKDYEKKLSRG